MDEQKIKQVIRCWLLQDAVIMLLGAIMLAVATGTTTNGWVIMYAISQLVFGFGVGGQPFRFSAWLQQLSVTALLLLLLH